MSGAGKGPGTLLQIRRMGEPFSWQASSPGPLGRCSRGYCGKHCVNAPVEVTREDRNTIHGKGDTN